MIANLAKEIETINNLLIDKKAELNKLLTETYDLNLVMLDYKKLFEDKGEDFFEENDWQEFTWINKYDEEVCCYPIGVVYGGSNPKILVIGTNDYGESKTYELYASESIYDFSFKTLCEDLEELSEYKIPYIQIETISNYIQEHKTEQEPKIKVYDPYMGITYIISTEHEEIDEVIFNFINKFYLM